MMTDRPTRRAPRGRPRDPSRDRAILAAARTVIAERGFTGATMDDIARTARVGKDTLYRRWSSKEQLAIDLVDSLATDAVRPLPIDPDPRFNLLMFLKDIVRLNRTTDFGPLVVGVLGASSRNPELAEPFRAFWQRRRSIITGLVRDVVGDDCPDDEVQLHLDRLLGPIYYRLLLSGDDIPDSYLWELVTALPWSSDTATPHPPVDADRVDRSEGSSP
jgi:AcrR family transcriptional regulator